MKLSEFVKIKMIKCRLDLKCIKFSNNLVKNHEKVESCDKEL